MKHADSSVAASPAAGPRAKEPLTDPLARLEAITPNSKRLIEEARRYTAGGLSHNARFHKPYPLFFNRAEGSRVWDVDGNVFIDLWMAHYDAILGHSPPEVMASLRAALENGLHIGLPVAQELDLARHVTRWVPGAQRVRFCVSGTESTMYALRLARGFTRRGTVIKMVGGWHGANTELMVDVSPPVYGMPESLGLPPELTQGVRTVEFNDIQAARNLIREVGDDLAAVIVEPMLGSVGMIPAEPEYLAGLREETTKAGALLIFDEIITGFRVALGGASQTYGVQPDLVTLGKVLGGGMAIGAVAGREDVLALSDITRNVPKWEKVVIGGGTYACNPLSMAAGSATLEILSREQSTLYPSLRDNTRYVTDGIRQGFSQAGIPVTITGMESLFCVHFTREKDHPVRSMADILEHTFYDKYLELAQRLRVNGVFMFHNGAISTTHSRQDLDAIIRAFHTAAQEMAQGG
ncbi:MAG: aspartate aminotransferase family protein [Deltaproteobacteria bacterium]|nr:aspartate aminotransferase family protein [Deltaproteobacteria bacterium]